MVVTHTYAKPQVQRSLGSKERVETNGQMEGTDYFAFPTKAVGNQGRIQTVCIRICFK